MSDPTPAADSPPPVPAVSTADLGTAFESYRDYLLAIANQKIDPAIRTKGGASDIVQETFLEAQRDIGQFTGTTGAELKAWLVRLLLNNVINFARSYKGTDKRQVARETGLPAYTPSGPAGAGLPGDTPTPSVEMMADERAVVLHRAIARLPEDYRRVIVLRNQEDLPFAEIATLMDRTENAVRKLWFRAVELLQQEMERAAVIPPNVGDDDDLADVLAACDEALAGGEPSALTDDSGLPPAQARLLKNLECVRLLRQVWPRQDSTLTDGKKTAGLERPVLERLGRFQIGKELGRGGFGIVYLAFDPQLARTVALKIPRPDVLSTPLLRERFRQEASSSLHLN